MPRRSKAEEQLDFEIRFYEKLLAVYPNFIDALIPLGDAYTRRGLYDKGLQVDLKLTELRGHDPLIWYNLACSYARLKRIDEACEALRRSVARGYTDLHALQSDPDLQNLRQSTKYREVLELFAALPASQPNPQGAGPSSTPPSG